MRRKNRLLFVGLLIGLMIGLSAPLAAQKFSADIRGTVTSETDAVLPGAQVTLSNEETGYTRSTVTNSSGNYAFANVPVGIYDIRIELEAFKVAIIEDIVLNVADVREVSAQLQIGEIAEEITVTSSRVLVETIGGEVSGTVSGQEIRELPLNGRNFAQLTQLMPGVSAPDGLNFKNKGLLSGVDLSVSGSSVTGNQWTVDGANNNDYGSNRTILITPSVDAIEEFKIHRNSYGPEFGGAGGAQVNVVTKSGTNRFAGSLYEFHRNDALNEANEFLRVAGQPKEKINRDDFGFTFGGPAIQDKLHFFVSQEWNDETRGTVRAAFVPTAAERLGDFSGPRDPNCSTPIPIDPLTGQPFPGNIIPEDRLSPGGLALLNLYPQPNTTPSGGNCNNWVASVPTGIKWAQTNARLDWAVTDSTRALVRYTRDTWENGAPNAGAGNGLWGDDPFPAVDSTWDQPGDSLVAQINQVIGSSTVNTFTYSMSGNKIDITRGDETGLNAQINALIPPVFPDEGRLNGSERSHPVYWGGATGADLWNIAPWNNEQDLMVLKDDYQQVFGNHYMKAGALYSQNSKVENCCGASAFEAPHFWGGAGIGGWGATSGNRIADILIRDMYHGFDETATQLAPEMEWEDIEVYVGDSWKLRSNLTVDLGVRYSRFRAPVAKDNNIVSFDPNQFDPTLGNQACNGVAQVPGTNPCADAGLNGGGVGVSRSFVEEDTNNFAPRLGIAWDMKGNGNSVLRAGLGQYFQRERVNIQLDFAGQPPFTQNVNGIRPLDNNSFIGGGGFGTPNRGIDPNNQTPYNIQYNLTWEQRFGANSSLEVSYVGNRGRHLLTKSDVNQVAPGDNNGNGVEDRLEFLRGAGDGDGSVRPFFTGGPNRILYWETNGSSEYDGLQTQYRSYFGRGSQLQVSYTLSRFKANTSVLSSSAGEENVQTTDRSNLDLDYGNADLHRKHILNASLVWNAPTFENRRGLVRSLLGNWTISTVVSYASGTPLTVYAIDVPGLGGSGYAGTGYDDNNRAIRVPGVPCNGSGSQIINPAAYTLSGLRLGDTSQMSRRGDCEGPDFFQVDLAFYKNIRLTKRFDAQFRIEIFNVTNEVNYIGASVNNSIRPFNVTLDAPLGQATQIVSAEIPGDFGQATAARDPRQVQVGFKISF